MQRSWSWNVTAITPNTWSESDQKAIREQLVRILNSGPFHQAHAGNGSSSTSSMKRWLAAAIG
jgi:hypothetical protein